MHTLILLTLLRSAFAADSPPSSHEGHAAPMNGSKHAQGSEPRTLARDSAMRIGSGTAWRPASAPMFGWMSGEKPWTWMVHGNIVGAWDLQGSDRGASQVSSLNWVMGEALLEAGRGNLGARAMLSAEPLTLRGDGYPLLGQTGETWRGEPLHDRQHPHDLFMELALHARQAVSPNLGVELTEKSAEDLVLQGVAEDQTFLVPSVAVGHLATWEPARRWSLGLGVRANVLLLGAELEPFYGTRLPAGLLVYAQVRPAAMQHDAAMQHKLNHSGHGGHMGGH